MSCLRDHKKYLIVLTFAAVAILYFIYGLKVNNSPSVKRRFLGPKYRNRTYTATAANIKDRSHFLGKELLKATRSRWRVLPNAIEIGVRKGGTRALLKALSLNPKIEFCSKEVHFFDRDDNYKKGLEWYKSRMPLIDGKPGQIVMEKSPAYFVTKSVPERVYNMSRTVKLIVVVRDPVKRAISDYTQLKSKSPKMKAFESYVVDSAKDVVIKDEGFVRIGRYAEHLTNWLRYFPMSQIHVVSGEKLVQDPVSELRDVERFLDLKPVITKDDFFFNKTKGFPCFRDISLSNTKVYTCLGKTKGRQHPKVSEKVLQTLRNYYRPYNQQFYQMVGRDFGWP